MEAESRIMVELKFNFGYISPLLFLDDICASLLLPVTVKTLAYTISELFLMEDLAATLPSSEFARVVLTVAGDYIDEEVELPADNACPGLV